MQNDKCLRMLGLAMRAGRLALGEGAARDSIRAKKAKLVIVSQDASGNTKKKLSDSCRFYSVPYFEYGDRIMLGSAAGRAFAVTIAVNDEGFANALIDILQN